MSKQKGLVACMQVFTVSKGCDKKQPIGPAMNVAERRAV